MPPVGADWATQAFERVQVDAKERLRTKDGKACCYLNFIDEYGAELDAFVFPYGRINQVPVQAVIDCVRCVLWRWGFIQCFRADNGRRSGPDPPITDTLEPLPAGLGHGGKTNPPPVHPAKRKGGTQPRNNRPLGDPTVRGDYLDLQERLNQAVLDQRENFLPEPARARPVQSGSRAFSNPRKFNPGDFDIQRAYRHLAQGSWQRKISSVGTTNVFGQVYQVGYQHRNQMLTATFDAQ
ncbi:MAG: hypothetical protein IPM82_15270 [Saprospiraceae bacterium]|nr:hypothetical protein [Saprospiraceae bacterium]